MFCASLVISVQEAGRVNCSNTVSLYLRSRLAYDEEYSLPVFKFQLGFRPNV